jgi:hypothetical protein
MAMNLARLFQRSSYERYTYRIRSCWWGAEEHGMIGSYHHVEEANTTTVERNRLKYYIMMLNFDMFASPNYYFGIYESTLLPDQVSSTVKNALLEISKVFRNWFDKENLPWDNSSLLLKVIMFRFWLRMSHVVASFQEQMVLKPESSEIGMIDYWVTDTVELFVQHLLGYQIYICVYIHHQRRRTINECLSTDIMLS